MVVGRSRQHARCATDYSKLPFHVFLNRMLMSLPHKLCSATRNSYLLAEYINNQVHCQEVSLQMCIEWLGRRKGRRYDDIPKKELLPFVHSYFLQYFPDCSFSDMEKAWIESVGKVGVRETPAKKGITRVKQRR